MTGCIPFWFGIRMVVDIPNYHDGSPPLHDAKVHVWNEGPFFLLSGGDSRSVAPLDVSERVVEKKQ